MKKQILGLGLFMMVLSSCSKEDSSNENVINEIPGEIKVDYCTNMIHYDDFVVNNDNTVYFAGQESNTEGIFMRFKKIDLNGKVTTLMNLDFTKFFSTRLCNTATGEILLFTFNYSYGNKIFRFEKNYTELNPFYTMKPTSSPYASVVGITDICNNEDGTFFVYDYNLKLIKRVVPTLDTDILIAGSGKAEIRDGTALDAGFKDISQIISRDNIVYIIDGSPQLGEINAIRKIEYATTGWKVTTLISTTTDVYKNIAVDSQNNFYVLLKDKGIYKLNLQDNTLSVYKDGLLKIGFEDKHFEYNLRQVNFMRIKNNDLYLENKYNLIKISNFQTKL